MSCNEDNLQLFATEKQYVDVDKNTCFSYLGDVAGDSVDVVILSIENHVLLRTILLFQWSTHKLYFLEQRIADALAKDLSCQLTVVYHNWKYLLFLSGTFVHSTFYFSQRNMKRYWTYRYINLVFLLVILFKNYLQCMFSSQMMFFYM